MGAAEHLLADIGNRAAAARRCAGQALHRTRAEASLITDHDRNDRAARPLLFIGDEIADLGYRHDRDFSPQAFRKPFLGGALLQSRNDLAFDFPDVLEPVDAHEQRRIVAQLRQTQHLAEGAPLRRRHRGDAKPALPGFVDADRKGRPEPVDADAAHDVAAHERLEHDVFGDGDAGLENAQATGSPAPVLHAADDRGCGGDESPQAGKDAGLEIRRVHRRSFDRSDQLYQSRQRANGRIGRLELSVRALVAEPACLDVNEAGMALLDRGKIERRTIRRIDVAAIDKDVAVFDQFRQARRGVRIAGIERDARFVEIEKRKPRALPFRRQRRGPAKRIACGWFYLLNARAEIGKQPRAVTRRSRTPDLDNPQMRQRAHRFPMTK